MLTTLAATGIVLVSCLAYGLWATVRSRDWQLLVLQARDAIRTIPINSAPSGQSADLTPEGKRALGFLKEAAKIHRDSRLYESALDILEAEGRVGRRVFPSKTFGFRDLPADLLKSEQPYDFRPFRLTSDGRWLLVRGILFEVATGRAEVLSRAESAIGNYRLNREMGGQ